MVVRLSVAINPQDDSCYSFLLQAESMIEVPQYKLEGPRSIPDEVVFIKWPNPSSSTMAL
jgi:hypothetical protein